VTLEDTKVSCTVAFLHAAVERLCVGLPPTTDLSTKLVLLHLLRVRPGLPCRLPKNGSLRPRRSPSAMDPSVSPSLSLSRISPVGECSRYRVQSENDKNRFACCFTARTMSGVSILYCRKNVFVPIVNVEPRSSDIVLSGRTRNCQRTETKRRFTFERIITSKPEAV